MASLEISDELRAAIETVTNKRARFVLDHIVEHGLITADDIQAEGYREHRRAVMDCRDLGFPISKVPSPSGGGVGAWSLDLDAEVRAGRTGRKNFSKSFRNRLIAKAGGKCEVCGASQADRTLQIDHRIPYEIDPGTGDQVEAEYQMLCPSCNRTKSWTCEKECPNWTVRDPSVCETCMWGSPSSYEHIATLDRRQATITWDGPDGVAAYERLSQAADDSGLTLEELLRTKLNND